MTTNALRTPNAAYKPSYVIVGDAPANSAIIETCIPVHETAQPSHAQRTPPRGVTRGERKTCEAT
jgi:hypothetical protein